VIKTLEAQVGQFLLRCKCPVSCFLPGRAKDLSAPRVFYDASNGTHTTGLDAEETERMLESDARELVNFLNQLNNWYGSGDKRG
jgi:hypothetical protein